MKRILQVLTIITITFLSGCTKDEDDPLTTDQRERFLGTWHANSTGTAGTRFFDITITASNTDANQIIIRNFDQAGSNTYLPAITSGNNIALISTLIAGETIEGTGGLAGDQLSFAFTLDDGQTIENRNCTAHR